MIAMKYHNPYKDGHIKESFIVNKNQNKPPFSLPKINLVVFNFEMYILSSLDYMCPWRLVLNKKVLRTLIGDNMKNIMVTIKKKRLGMV
jgi:hypothetical protein